MTRYVIETERYEIDGREGWHCDLSAATETGALVAVSGTSLHGADGDNEQEAITITICQYLGKLPADFPPDLIADQ